MTAASTADPATRPDDAAAAAEVRALLDRAVEVYGDDPVAHRLRDQRRRLDDGREYEVLKNFLPATELRELIRDSGGVETEIGELTYYWWATYMSGTVTP